jgi:sugar transferase (PEP-CTERM system associated)
MAHIRLFNHYLQTPYILLGLIECGLLVLSVWVAFYLRFPDEAIRVTFLDEYWLWRGVIFALVLHASTLAMGVYDSFLREGFVSMAVRTVVAYCLLGTSLFTALHLSIGWLYLGNAVLVIAIIVAMVAVIATRRLFFHLVDVSQLRRRVVLYGAGNKANNLLSLLASDSRIGVNIIGCIPSGGESQVDESLCLEAPADWRVFTRDNKVSEIVVVPDERRRGEGGGLPLKDLLDCKLSGIDIIDAISFCERETGKIELELLHPSWMLFSDGFQYSQYRDFAKRVFDLAISLVLIVLLWPVMLLTMLVIFLESGRPIIYRQTRVGLNGANFELLKFRSMVKNAEKAGEAVWAQANDSRITKVGQFTRNTRLDELPQLWNVLKGEMSFVGPRPERPEFVGELAKNIPFYDERHRVKPGLMGWAQLNYPYGATEEDAAQKLRYDLYYTKNHSLLLDSLTVLQTVEIILLGKGVR